MSERGYVFRGGMGSCKASEVPIGEAQEDCTPGSTGHCRLHPTAVHGPSPYTESVHTHCFLLCHSLLCCLCAHSSDWPLSAQEGNIKVSPAQNTQKIQEQVARTGQSWRPLQK